MSVRSVLIVAPDNPGASTGNEVSVARLQSGLRRRALEATVCRPGECDECDEDRVTPGLVHGFHARRTGPAALACARRLKRPFVLTLTGTDTDLDMFDAERRAEVERVIRQADAVICGHAGARQAAAALRGSGDGVFVAPKGVLVPDPLPAPVVREAGRIVVLIVAHVRPVKNVELAVEVVGELQQQGFPIDLWVLGDVLDEAYAEALQAAAGGATAWSQILRPAVAAGAVGPWYAAADIVLNTSHGEGGSNAVLEAMAHGCAVVGSAIPGNAQYLGVDAARGLLYPVEVQPDGAVHHDAQALGETLLGLATDTERREELGRAAREWVRVAHDPELEIDGVLEAYAYAIASAGR